MARKEPQNIDAEISVLGCGFLDTVYKNNEKLWYL